MNKMKNSKKRYKKFDTHNTKILFEILDNHYKDAKCGLEFNSPYEIVIALILAAQCTDKRVNEILPIFMEKFKTIENVANSSQAEIISIIKPCGYYNSKSKSILETSKILVNNYNMEVPNTMEELLTLKGIGRKSANIILQECFNKTEGIAVDTHVTRISRKIGLSNGNTQEKIENDLMKTFDKNMYSRINHIFVTHGRKICIANRPKCDICPIKDFCMKND